MPLIFANRNCIPSTLGGKTRRFLQAPVLVLSLTLLAVVLACGGESPAPGGNTESAETAPDFAITLLRGSEALGNTDLNFSDLQGKPIVLNFWAGLCPPCRAEMPDMQEFYDERQDQVTMLGVDIGQFMGLGTVEDAEALLHDLDITYPAGFTNDGTVVQGFKVLGMPTTVFINPDGTIFNKWTGALNRKTLDEQVDKLMEQQE